MVTIPASLRTRLDIEPGDKLRWEIDEEGNLSVEVVRQRYGAFEDFEAVSMGGGGSEPHDAGAEPTITLTEDGDWWVANDTKTGVTSQGRTRREALNNLVEALVGYHDEGEEPTEAELREPESNRRTTSPGPWTSLTFSNDGTSSL